MSIRRVQVSRDTDIGETIKDDILRHLDDLTYEARFIIASSVIWLLSHLYYTGQFRESAPIHSKELVSRATAIQNRASSKRAKPTSGSMSFDIGIYAVPHSSYQSISHRPPGKCRALCGEHREALECWVDFGIVPEREVHWGERSLFENRSGCISEGYSQWWRTCSLRKSWTLIAQCSFLQWSELYACEGDWWYWWVYAPLCAKWTPQLIFWHP
jgi:hypothetical protein